jgi:hypothetical protein
MKRGALLELNSQSVQDFYEIPLNDEIPTFVSQGVIRAL